MRVYDGVAHLQELTRTKMGKAVEVSEQEIAPKTEDQVVMARTSRFHWFSLEFT
jgi:hypothetical protein